MLPFRTLHNETQRHLRRCSGATDLWVEHLDTLIRGLVRDGLWDKIITINVAGPDSSDSLLNLKDPTESGNGPDSVLVGSPAFIANQGFTTVGLSPPTDYIDTQYAGGSVYNEQNNLALSVYVRTKPVVSGTFIGAEAWNAGLTAIVYWTYLRYFNTGTLVQGYNQNKFGVTSMATDNVGFRYTSRGDASNAAAGYDGNQTIAVQASAYDATANRYNMFVGARNQKGNPIDGAPCQYAHWGIANYLDFTDAVNYYTHLQAYFTSQGVAV